LVGLVGLSCFGLIGLIVFWVCLGWVGLAFWVGFGFFGFVLFLDLFDWFGYFLVFWRLAYLIGLDGFLVGLDFYLDYSL